MAKVFGPALSGRASGVVSPGMVFKCYQEWFQFSKYRDRKNRRPKKSLDGYYILNPGFRAQQEKFKLAAAKVKAMSAEDRELWEVFAKKYLTHDSCSYTTAAISYTMIAMSYCIVSLLAGQLMPGVPTEITSATAKSWELTQASLQSAGRGWMSIAH